MRAFSWWLITGGLAIGLTMPALAQQTEVRWLHVEGDPPQVAWMEETVEAFEAQNPDVDIQMQYIAAEPYKARLTTMLQSDDRPHIFYTWAGGVMRAQADAGVLQDISEHIDDGWGDTISAAALDAYRYGDEIYGVPWEITQVGFWYNRELFDQAGLDAESIVTWTDFLQAVETLQDAGITPIAVGGADKWPLHFYWTHLAVRIGGRDAFDVAISGEGEGFTAPPFVEAGERFLELIALEPFQPGFLAAGFPQAGGYFGDGNAAMQLQGNWNYLTQRTNSVSGEGLSDEQLGWFSFPIVEGGAGNPSDTLGGVTGFLIAADAPEEAVDFLRFLTSEDSLRTAAERGLQIPVTLGAAASLDNPFFQGIAENLENSDYHQNFYDQDLGPEVGRVVNDISTDLAAGILTPEDAAQILQDAWEFANM